MLQAKSCESCSSPATPSAPTMKSLRLASRSSRRLRCIDLGTSATFGSSSSGSKVSSSASLAFPVHERAHAYMSGCLKYSVDTHRATVYTYSLYLHHGTYTAQRLLFSLVSTAGVGLARRGTANPLQASCALERSRRCGAARTFKLNGEPSAGFVYVESLSL